MSFLEYISEKLTLPLPSVKEEPILIIPISCDSLMFIQNDNSFQIIRVRENSVLVEGKLSNNFIPVSHLRPIGGVPAHKNYVYIIGSTSLCRININNGEIEERNEIEGAASGNAEYWVLDESGYLLCKIQNVENKSVSLSVYEWDGALFSNTVSLGGCFFNPVLTNVSNHTPLSKLQVGQQVKLGIIGNDPKICYNHISIEKVKENDGYRILIKEAGKKLTGFMGICLFGLLGDGVLFLGGNCGKLGPGVIRVFLENNENELLPLKEIDEIIQTQPGLIRNHLLTTKTHVLFTFYCLNSRTTSLFKISLDSLPCQLQNLNAQSEKICQLEGTVGIGIDGINGRITTGIDGESLWRVWGLGGKVGEMCRNSFGGFEGELDIEIMYPVPKKFYYGEIAKELNFEGNLIVEILDLL